MSYPYLEDFINVVFGLSLSSEIVPMFGLIVTLGMIISLKLFIKEMRSVGFSNQDCLDIESTVYGSFFFGLIGAKLFHAFEFMDRGFVEQIFSRGGFSIFGGLIMAFLYTHIKLRKNIKYLVILDTTSPYLLLGYAIGRVGCQLSGDGDWGVASDLALKPNWIPTSLWAQTYTGNIAGVAIPSPGVYPTPIYEAAMAFIGFIALLLIRKKLTETCGALFSVYLIFTGLSRILVERIRINPSYDIVGIRLTQAEFISLGLIILGLAGMSYLLLSRRKAHPTIAQEKLEI